MNWNGERLHASDNIGQLPISEIRFQNDDPVEAALWIAASCKCAWLNTASGANPPCKEHAWLSLADNDLASDVYAAVENVGKLNEPLSGLGRSDEQYMLDNQFVEALNDESASEAT